MIDAASLGSVFLFWLAIGACGLLAWPLAARLLPGDGDLGYLAAKPLGWLIGSYSAWLASYAGVPFWRFGWLAGVTALIVVFVACLKPVPALPRLPRILQWEAGFAAALLVGVLIKGERRRHRWAGKVHGLRLRERGAAHHVNAAPGSLVGGRTDQLLLFRTCRGRLAD